MLHSCHTGLWALENNNHYRFQITKKFHMGTQIFCCYNCDGISQGNNSDSLRTWTQQSSAGGKEEEQKVNCEFKRVLFLIFFLTAEKSLWFAASLFFFTLGINWRMRVTQEDRCIMGRVVWPEPVRTVCCVCVDSMRWPWPRVRRHPSILSAAVEKEKDLL